MKPRKFCGAEEWPKEGPKRMSHQNTNIIEKREARSKEVARRMYFVRTHRRSHMHRHHSNHYRGKGLARLTAYSRRQMRYGVCILFAPESGKIALYQLKFRTCSGI